MIRIGTRITPSNFCFSKIVSAGHIGAALETVRQHEDTYLWLPVMIDMPVKESREPGMFCPWTQATYFTLRHPFSLETEERVLHPIIHLREPARMIASQLYPSLGPAFGLRRRQIQKALDKAFEAQLCFEHALTDEWESRIEPGLENKPAIVIIGRPYMLHDTKLNLRIGAEISRLGVTAIPMDFLPASGTSLYETYPNMYWGEGAEILRAVLYCADHPNLFPVVISNFGCGPDSFLSKYIEEILEKKTGKPFLEIELDAHSARAGMVTRLEAFHDVVYSYQRVRSGGRNTNTTGGLWRYQETNYR
jgi:predicted nucleotide-binding protein (sugar kinase/HSP70/actin superfamily)